MSASALATDNKTKRVRRRGVKRRPEAKDEPDTTDPPQPPKKGWRRHFEGWPMLVVAGFIAGGTAMLIVPRPVRPDVLPSPRVDYAVVAGAMDSEVALAAEAEEETLAHDVRAMGSAIRAFGRADASGERDELAKARQEIAVHAQASLLVGLPAVQRLRAFQTQRFLWALDHWVKSGEETDDLIELGGGILLLLRRHQWVRETDASRELTMPLDVARVLFIKRWNQITNLSELPELQPSVDEERLLTGFLFAHPAIPKGRAERRDPSRPDATAENEYLMRKVNELAALDDSYPADLARGILLFRLGRYRLAVKAFQAHLEVHPDGPWTLRAQNFLRASLGRAEGETID